WGSSGHLVTLGARQTSRRSNLGQGRAGRERCTDPVAEPVHVRRLDVLRGRDPVETGGALHGGECGVDAKPVPQRRGLVVVHRYAPSCGCLVAGFLGWTGGGALLVRTLGRVPGP